jgi:hypothetical protein
MGGVCRCWISNLSRIDCTVTRRGSHTLSIFLFFFLNPFSLPHVSPSWLLWSILSLK